MTIPTHDPTTSPYWPFFTDQERQTILDHPIDYTSSEKDILRLLIEDIINSQNKPPTNPGTSSKST